MTRKEKRVRMDKAIKEFTVPFLRENGFKGSLPHFRRIQNDRINLLTIQYSLNHEQFVVEISNCPVKGITTSWGKQINPNKCTAHDMGHRLRLGSERLKGDYWFDYSEGNLFSDIYEEQAKKIISFWEQAQQWWGSDPFELRNQN
jgi:hypothetical protein